MKTLRGKLPKGAFPMGYVKIGRLPMNGDVYMFMSKDQRKVRMIHYERNAYYLHEKSFIKGYRFMRIERKDDVTVYKIDWKDLVTILETPVITSIRI